MKCAACMEGLYASIRKELGKDKALIAERMHIELLNSEMDAVTIDWRGYALCLKHWVNGR